MPELTYDTVRNDFLHMLQELREDWEYAGDLTETTGIFHDLGFGSIDVVALGSAIEEHFDQSLPFAEFMTRAHEQQWTEITIGQVLDFLMANLHGLAEKKEA